VLFWLRRGAHDLGRAVRSTANDLAFNFAVQVRRGDDASDFADRSCRGRPGGRFLDIDAEKRAGDVDSPGATMAPRVVARARNAPPEEAAHDDRDLRLRRERRPVAEGSDHGQGGEVATCGS
jgi:hypothetical protein